VAAVTGALVVAVLLPLHAITVAGKAARRFLTTGTFRTTDADKFEVYPEFVSEPF
jgi:hypothetical protein